MADVTKKIDTTDLVAIHDLFVKLALRAGHLLRLNSVERCQTSTSGPSSIDTLDIKEKDSSVDIVTQLDTLVEQLVVNGIREVLGDQVEIIAEESYGKSRETKCVLDNKPTVILDPLDGTVNFTHLFPTVCVAIGYCMNKIPVVGVTYAPLLAGLTNPSGGTLWSSIQGRGAFQSQPTCQLQQKRIGELLEEPDPSCCYFNKLENQPDNSPCPPFMKLPLIQPPLPFPTNPPKGCLIVAEWGKDRRDCPESNLVRKLETLKNLASAAGTRDGRGGGAHGVRSLGSSSLDIIYVACGSADIMWEGGCWEWDICAGMATLLEAGGWIVDANPPAQSGEPAVAAQPIPLAPIGGRRYLAVRGCSGREGRTARDEQERVINAVWERVVPLTYERYT